MENRVLVAMSGGVDSSVAALLLKESGYDVVGVTMCFGFGGRNDKKPICCGANAVNDARGVCQRIGIPHYVLDYAAELEKKVIGKFISEYERGRTPNPCVDCNRFLKFDSLLKMALLSGFDFLATGHYAGIEKNDGLFHLMRARDGVKDQSYFLYVIAREYLPKILFPLASLTKEEVRDIARRAGLEVAQKAESQDICFTGGNGLGRFFIERGIEPLPGPIVDTHGKVLGRHGGIINYTIGQRDGLRISAGKPLYVIAKDPAGNRLIVGGRENLRSRSLIAGEVNLLVESLPRDIRAKIRYRGSENACQVERQGEKIAVHFVEEVQAVSPGQAVVLYDGGLVLGGGTIEEVIRN